jgi:Tol biopolymer transport system component
MRYRVLGAVLLGLGLAGSVGCQGDSVAEADGSDRGIVFSSSRDGDFEIYVMDDEGRNVRQLTRNAAEGANEADDSSPSWSPDRRGIVFASTRDHQGDGADSQEIYVMQADGSGQTRLTENETAEAGPAWSPDGDSLLYARRPVAEPTTDQEAAFELALMRPDGSGARTLVEIGGLGWGALSPDGSSLAFTRCAIEERQLDCEIWLAKADGTHARKLVDSRGRDVAPAWSPGGEKVAFTSDRDRNGDCFFPECSGHNGEIYVMDADGSHQTRVTDDPGDDSWPTWSPDGTRIAFAGLRDVQGGVDAPDENYEIYVVDADGSDLLQITDNVAWDWQPGWS